MHARAARDSAVCSVSQGGHAFAANPMHTMCMTTYDAREGAGMPMSTRRALAVLGLVLGLALGTGVISSPARAQIAVENFYKGRTVELVIGTTPGGSYDLYGRLIARNLGKHIPGNPTVIVKNMPGAGHLRMTNWLYNVAPRDGS